MRDAFAKFAARCSGVLGSPWAFSLAVLTILVWAISGPALGFSEAWQLAINTGTTIVTFLMVFIIQNTQNRDARAIHLKLDELLEAVANAREELVDIEHATEAELEKREKEFAAHHEEAAAMSGR
jgi:low affinity Fe/Cu permease